MGKRRAVITGVGGYVPDYILNNEELSRMVETNDEWIMTRVGIKERRILTEEGLGTSYLARKAAKQLLQKTGVDPDTIDALILTTSTADYQFPSTASIVLGKLGLKNAHAFDFWAACCGFVYTLDTVACMIESGRYNKVIIIGADKMSSVVDYKDRATCPLFGDGAGAVLVEATEDEEVGYRDSYFRTDGKGLPFLHLKAGGSVCPPSHFTVDHRLHYLYQEGRTVFRYAVTNMSNDCVIIAERNGLNKDNIQWVVPHQANMRIIEAVAKRLDLPMEQVMVNIEHFGNTSAGTIPLALWEYESKLRKGDNRLNKGAFGFAGSVISGINAITGFMPGFGKTGTGKVLKFAVDLTDKLLKYTGKISEAASDARLKSRIARQKAAVIGEYIERKKVKYLARAQRITDAAALSEFTNTPLRENEMARMAISSLGVRVTLDNSEVTSDLKEQAFDKLAEKRAHKIVNGAAADKAAVLELWRSH